MNQKIFCFHIYYSIRNSKNFLDEFLGKWWLLVWAPERSIFTFHHSFLQSNRLISSLFYKNLMNKKMKRENTVYNTCFPSSIYKFKKREELLLPFLFVGSFSGFGGLLNELETYGTTCVVLLAGVPFRAFLPLFNVCDL